MIFIFDACILCCTSLQGKSYGGGGRNKLLDLGDGYDTEDSFIDNEEAVRFFL